MEPDKIEILDSPVLVVGAPRSGTTWIQRLLLAHRQVRGGQESHFFSHFTPAMDVFWEEHHHRFTGMHSYWTAEALANEIKALWYKTMLPMLDGEDGRILVEKSPEHALRMDHIHRLLPRAKFIHVIRDSRAVVASMLAASKEEWGQDWAPKNARDAAVRWYWCVSAARQSGERLGPGAYLEVFYEDVLRNPLRQVLRMFEFVGLEISDDEARRIVAEQSFKKQKAIGGTPFRRKGELASEGTVPAKEPSGFFRKGQADAWKKELSVWQKLITWRYTRKLMYTCGYNWGGRRECRDAAPEPAGELSRSAKAETQNV